MSAINYECGTRNARRRHQRRGERCATCASKRRQLKPCGTPAAYNRHLYNGEKPCEPCRKAHNKETSATARRTRERGKTQPKKSPHNLSAQTNENIEELMFLLNAGEGEARILQALGTNHEALKRFLYRHNHHHLIPRIFTPWELAA